MCELPRDAGGAGALEITSHFFISHSFSLTGFFTSLDCKFCSPGSLMRWSAEGRGLGERGGLD